MRPHRPPPPPRCLRRRHPGPILRQMAFRFQTRDHRRVADVPHRDYWGGRWRLVCCVLDSQGQGAAAVSALVPLCALLSDSRSGSTTVQPYDDLTYEPVELGASVFVEINKNLWRATNEFNLSRKNFEEDSGETGFWDGEDFVFKMGTVGGTIGSWFDSLKVIWRYGYTAPTKAQRLVKQMTDKFVGLYAPSTPSWTNLTTLTEDLGWTELLAQTGGEYFQSNGVSKKFTYELIEAATLVNYAQDVDSIHALEAACSVAASGASSVKGGNWQIFDAFVKHSGANVFLDTVVNSISRKSATHWTVRSNKGTLDYRAVILAAPYHTSDISLPSDLATLIPAQPYVRLHVTLLTTTAPAPNPVYFGLAEGAKAPTAVLTTLEGMRNGKRAPEFNSLTYHGKVRRRASTEAEPEPEPETHVSAEKVVEEEGKQDAEAAAKPVEAEKEETAPEKDEWVVKIFSMAPVSDEWLANMFQGQVGWVLRQEWDSYPVLPPTSTFPPIKLDRGLFYVNAFEPFISTMETETLASRNIVDWLLREEFGAAICPAKPADADSAEPEPRPKAKDFVYGWDC
ncbi:hypothetical protein EVG20_g8889 [Dentipellis fragilis]|uniref:Prenylcysteine lyase domain-containing protein n=1 Tax=Dentipellis fragilis TaxID=205917 RepID=A0A4Y9Y4N1_9AGAM|nr:hypothetical protein EVG20_g8889 [Dentipellis fragilis]